MLSFKLLYNVNIICQYYISDTVREFFQPLSSFVHKFHQLYVVVTAILLAHVFIAGCDPHRFYMFVNACCATAWKLSRYKLLSSLIKWSLDGPGKSCMDLHTADTILHVHSQINAYDKPCTLLWGSDCWTKNSLRCAYIFSIHFVIPAHHKGSIVLGRGKLFFVFHLLLSLTNHNNELLLAAERLDCRCMRLVLL